jgi:hypothetical protein
MPAPMTSPAELASSILLESLSVGVVVVVVLYVWTAASLQAVFRKAGHVGWPAWVPILNTVTLLRLGGLSGWWCALLLVPGLGAVVVFVVYVIAAHRVGRAFGFGGGMTVLAALLAPVWSSVLGWGSARWIGTEREISSRGTGSRGIGSRGTGSERPLSPGPRRAPAGAATSRDAEPVGVATAPDESRVRAPEWAPRDTAAVEDVTGSAGADAGAAATVDHAVATDPAPAAGVTGERPAMEPVADADILVDLFDGADIVDSENWADSEEWGDGEGGLGDDASDVPPPVSAGGNAMRAGYRASLSLPPLTNDDPDRHPLHAGATFTGMVWGPDAPDASEPGETSDLSATAETPAAAGRTAQFDDDPDDRDVDAADPDLLERWASLSPFTQSHVPRRSPVPEGTDPFPETSAEVSAVAPAPGMDGPMAASATVAAGQAVSERPDAGATAGVDSRRDGSADDGSDDAGSDDAGSDDAGPDDTVIAARRRPIWRLLPSEGTPITLTGAVAIVGRRPAADPLYAGAQLVAVFDETRTVSKTHARLELHGEHWTIVDLRSTNGVVLFGASGEDELTPDHPRPATERFLLGDAEFRLAVDR